MSCQDKNATISSSSLNKINGIYKYKEKSFTGLVLDTTKAGRVLLTFNCVDGKVDGEHLRYHKENGNLKQRTTYQNGKKTGPYIELTKDGGNIITGNYLDYKKSGEWKEFYNNGNIKSEGYYENGLKTGEWKFFFYNGNLKTAGSYLTRNEPKPGKTGIPKQVRSGIWKFYFEDTGKLKQESAFQNGAITGKSVSYYPNGKIEIIANLKNNQYHGTVEFYDRSGKLEEKRIYKNDKLIENKK